jgi:hypothetical protein
MAMIGKLTALRVAREKRPGVYADGGGLYLQVTNHGSKSWIFRFWVAERDPKTGEIVRDPATNKVCGRGRKMGLGSCITVSLAEARDRALPIATLRRETSLQATVASRLCALSIVRLASSLGFPSGKLLLNYGVRPLSLWATGFRNVVPAR